MGRTILAIVVAVATYYFVFWVGGALLLGLKLPTGALFSVATIAALVAAIVMARYVWRRTASAEGLLTSILSRAILTGAVGFCLGFFGPMIFSPGANQGPLLGIFITGPAGFLLGAIGGWVKWAARRAREQSPSA